MTPTILLFKLKHSGHKIVQHLCVCEIWTEHPPKESSSLSVFQGSDLDLSPNSTINILYNPGQAVDFSKAFFHSLPESLSLSACNLSEAALRRSPQGPESSLKVTNSCPHARGCLPQIIHIHRTWP